MNKSSLVSVIMPVYDGDKLEYLRIAIDSIMSQTYENIEVVIIADGVKRSDLKEALSKYAKNINIVIKEMVENRGIVSALNKALEIARGEYLVRMDADDISHPERVEKLAHFLDTHNEFCFVGSFLKEVDGSGKIISYRKYPISWNEVVAQLPWRVPFAHASCAFRKEFFQKIGGYSPRYFQNEDYELWFRAFYCNLRGTNIPEFLYEERIDAGKFGRRRGLKLALSEFHVKKDFLKRPHFSRFTKISPYVTFGYRMSPEIVLKYLYKVFR